MRRILLLCALLAAGFVQASEKETYYNTRYKETEADLRRGVFAETDEPLPPFPAAEEEWFDVYVSPMYQGQLLVLPDSIHPAGDRTVRYVLNVRSPQGINNISAEALYCMPGSFSSLTFSKKTRKKNSYKVYAYGDPVNRRWIEARNAQWQDLGGRPNSGAAVREALYGIWCVDGVPESREALLKRLNERGGKRDASGRQNKKDAALFGF